MNSDQAAGSISLTVSESGPYSAVGSSFVPGYTGAPLGAIATTGGTGEAIYEVLADTLLPADALSWQFCQGVSRPEKTSHDGVASRA